MQRNGRRWRETGTAWSSTSRTTRCSAAGGGESPTEGISSQCAPVCTTTHMTWAAPGAGWEAWGVPSRIRTRSALSSIPVRTFIQFPTGLNRSHPAPWKTVSSPRLLARCRRAFTALQTITSLWGGGSPFKATAPRTNVQWPRKVIVMQLQKMPCKVSISSSV